MSSDDLKNRSLALHKKYQGKIKMGAVAKVKSIEDLSLLYSPGVAYSSLAIKDNPSLAYDYTCKGRIIAVVSDGSAVLGLGNIGPLGALPVMEGKCLLFKSFAGVEAVPICLDTQDTEEIIRTVKILAPNFAGINLEDISAPRCVTIERRLKEELDIPVFHDDQHGTSIVVSAALLNLAKLYGLNLSDLTVVLSGTGAAGSSIARRIKKLGIKTIYAYNAQGVVKNANYDRYNFVVREMLDEGIIDSFDKEGATLADLMPEADIFVGVSVADLLTPEMVKTMKRRIVFALANPNPELSIENAQLCEPLVYATGRSDLPNQINNVLAFPGLFKGAIAAHATKITDGMIEAAIRALAGIIKDEELRPDYLIPNPFDQRVAKVIAKAVKKQAIKENVIRK
ncbi:MAG TPA: NADP-dependent malic enzyme [Bacilli bacterium]|jgi:malate dehydrogenase (oxaloacetate-decarboxylating)|nr:NADP-dependent malic enzyme [Bacilli bacterium]